MSKSYYTLLILLTFEKILYFICKGISINMILNNSFTSPSIKKHFSYFCPKKTHCQNNATIGKKGHQSTAAAHMHMHFLAYLLGRRDGGPSLGTLLFCLRYQATIVRRFYFWPYGTILNFRCVWCRKMVCFVLNNK